MPSFTPDHALDLLFSPDLIPLQVKSELHKDLHVCLQNVLPQSDHIFTYKWY
jgi:hypothetical protein